MTGDIPLFDFPAAWSMLPALLYAARLTFVAAIVGFALALVFGLVAYLLGRRARRITRFVRGTPLLVQLYVTYYLLPSAGIRLSAMTGGVLVIGMHFGCYVAEVYRAGFAAVPPGQLEAAKALGLSKLLSLRLVILPQAIPPMLPALGNASPAQRQWISLAKRTDCKYNIDQSVIARTQRGPLAYITSS